MTCSSRSLGEELDDSFARPSTRRSGILAELRCEHRVRSPARIPGFTPRPESGSNDLRKHRRGVARSAAKRRSGERRSSLNRSPSTQRPSSRAATADRGHLVSTQGIALPNSAPGSAGSPSTGATTGGLQRCGEREASREAHPDDADARSRRVLGVKRLGERPQLRTEPPLAPPSERPELLRDAQTGLRERRDPWGSIVGLPEQVRHRHREALRRRGDHRGRATSGLMPKNSCSRITPGPSPRWYTGSRIRERCTGPLLFPVRQDPRRCALGHGSALRWGRLVGQHMAGEVRAGRITGRDGRHLAAARRRRTPMPPSTWRARGDRPRIRA